MIKTIWGYGSLKIISLDGLTSITFGNSIHKLYYQKVNLRQTSITGKLFQTQIKFRPIIQCSIVSCTSEDIENLLRLVDILNSGVFYIQPQFSSLNTVNNTFECYIETQNIDFQHIASAQLGQIIDLSFIGRYLESSMADNYSNPELYDLIDELQNLIVDQSGNQLIITI